MSLTVELEGEGPHAHTNFYMGDQCSHKVYSGRWLHDLIVCEEAMWPIYAVMICRAKTKQTGNKADT